MALNTFTPNPPPSPGTTNEPKLKLLKAEFGDGYTQTTRDGLNHIRRTMTLRWQLLTPTQAATLESFFVGQGGDTPFYYTPTNEVSAVRWTCEKWNKTGIEAGFQEFTANLEQSFNLAVL
jgi:phage-related protein